ncbi:MAG: sugar phosphate isomerase/epimerase [Anaerolineae bacterium]|nr:sugar phosphate isomerase/epimerase [Anaerolineae bacterium]
MRIAIQESLLPGRSLQERIARASRWGLDGVEFEAKGLTARVPEIADVLARHAMKASAVNMGEQDGYLAPQLAEREQAISRLRQAMADAVDIGAPHVVFVPHFGGPRMPDLTPYRSPIELESEMLVWLLRTVSDLAYAIGVELDMLPVNHYETYFMNRLDQAIRFRQKIKDHRHVKVAANLFHLMLEEQDAMTALRTAGKHIGYLYITDSNGRLPGQGMMDFAALAQVLKEIEYDGWLTLTYQGQHPHHPAPSMHDLPDCLAMLRQTGL